VIRIEVKSKNRKELRKVAAELGVINKSVKSTAKSLGLFSNAFKGLIAFRSVRGLTQAADQFQLLRDRIKVFTGDSASARETFTKLLGVAKKTRTSISNVAEVFNRAALATSDMGLSIDEILGLTESLQQTFRLSGATAAEASAAQIQLFQGLSSGAVRGQELRSILEANSVLVGILSDKVGVARGSLIKFGETGGLTSKVVLAAMADNFEKLNKKASQLGTTFGQSLAIGIDALKNKVDILNETMGLNSGFQKGMFFLIENLETIIKLVTVLVSAVVLGKLVTLMQTLQIIAGGKAIVSFVAALGPIGAALAAAGVAVGFVVANMKELGNNKKDIKAAERQIFRLKKTMEDARTSFKNARIAMSNFNKVSSKRKNFQAFSALNRDLKISEKRFADANSRLRKMQRTLSDVKKTQKSSSGKKGNPLENFSGDAALNLKTLNEQLTRGVITFDKYRASVDLLNVKKLNTDFKDGKINIDQYNNALAQIPNQLNFAQTSMQAFSNSVDSMSDTFSLMGSTFTKVFTGLEDAMVAAFSSGKFEFKDFANSILKDMIRIAVRTSITIPLLQAFRSLLTGGFSFGASGASAGNFVKGASNITPNIDTFAKGGAFGGSSGGQLGIFGEAGPEAILPLTRGSGGELGVKAVGGGSGGGETVVNIFNNSGSGVETKESTNPNGQRQIDIMIQGKVKEMFASGQMDKQMGTNYGLQRQGS
jgi:lambda family phage tail tape measure protein